MDLLCQIQANQLGVSVARPTIQETTALGAAYLAGLAEGVWSTLEELQSKWHLDAQFDPDSALVDATTAQYEGNLWAGR